MQADATEAEFDQLQLTALLLVNLSQCVADDDTTVRYFIRTTVCDLRFKGCE